MKPNPRRVVAAYTGNPGGKPIYPNKVDHGYEDPIAGGSDVMQDLVQDLRHEQGDPKLASVKRDCAAFQVPRRVQDFAGAIEDTILNSGSRGRGRDH